MITYLKYIHMNTSYSKPVVGFIPPIKGENIKRSVVTRDMHTTIEKLLDAGTIKNFAGLYKCINERNAPEIGYSLLYSYVHRHFEQKLKRLKIEQLSVRESIADLEKLYEQSATYLKKRIRMLIMMKANPEATKNQVSLEVGVSPGTIREWHRMYRQGGIKKILDYKSVKGGRRSLITKETCEAIEQELSQTPNMSFVDLYEWVKANHVPEISYKTLQQYVRKHFRRQVLEMKLLHIAVTESLSDLEKMIEKSVPFVKPRLRMLMVLKQEQRITRSALAKKADIAYNSAAKWCDLYANGGLEKLLAVKRGSYNWDEKRKMVFPEDVQKAIEKWHLERPFNNYAEMHKWVSKNHLPDIKYSTLVKYAHAHLDTKLVIKRFIEVKVKEPVSLLEKLYHEAPERLKPRIKMLIVLAKGKKMTRSALAKEAGVTYGSIRKWHSMYKEEGFGNLVNNRKGNLITSDMHAGIEARLKAGSVKSFADLYNWVNQRSSAPIKYNTVHRYICRHFRTQLKEMRTLMHAPVSESLQELYNAANQYPANLKPRIRMLVELKKNPSIAKDKLAQLIDVKPYCVVKWCKLYNAEGIEGLMVFKRKGRKLLVLPTDLHDLIEAKLDKKPHMKIVDLHKEIRMTRNGKISYNKLYRYVRRHFNEPSHKKGTKSRAA